MRPMNSSVWVICCRSARTTPTAGGPPGAGCAWAANGRVLRMVSSSRRFIAGTAPWLLCDALQLGYCRCRFESGLNHLLHPLGPQETQGVARGLRDLLVILAVARRQDDGGQARAGSGDHLFLDAAN